MMMMSQCWIILFAITLSSRLAAVSSQPFDYPTANLSTSWINSLSSNRSVSFSDNSTVRPILLRGIFGPSYACGFYCNGACDSYLFAVFIVKTNSGGNIIMPAVGFPQVVWSANRNNPVGINASLQLTADGDLVLRDADGKSAWSSNTAGKGVLGLNLTELGNLVLFDKHNFVVWQSFDFPTDCLVPGQILASGKHLSASASSTNWTEGGLFSVSMTGEGLVASIQSDPLQVYYTNSIASSRRNSSYARFENGSLALYVDSVVDSRIDFPLAESAQYMKLGSDGHLRVFEWGGTSKEVADILTGYLGDCDYPMACGVYGVCSIGQCSCPMRWNFDGASFKQINDRHPDRGCYPVNPLTCEDSDKHSFLDLSDVTYFTFVADISDTDMDSCKEACLRNCSCKAAMFKYHWNSSSGNCYLPTQIFSLMNNEKDLPYYNSSVSLKVQNNATPSTDVEKFPTPATGKSSLLGPVLGSSLGVFCAVVLIGAVVLVYRGRKRKTEDVEEDYLDHVPGMLTSAEIGRLQLRRVK